MKVKDLIKQLKKFNPNLEILIPTVHYMEYGEIDSLTESGHLDPGYLFMEVEYSYGPR